MKLPRFALLIVLPALTLVLFGSRWFRRDARGAVPVYPTIARSTMLDRWTGGATLASAGEPTGGRPKKWWIIGWDGASWDLLLPLLENGRMPHLKRLMERGASASLHTIKPTLSPVVWTTIATGVPPSRHGILDFVRRPEGLHKALSRLSDEERQRLKFYSNADRQVRALWNLVSERNRPVLVVGYHNTYPAERVNGVMVSNYLVREHSLDAFGRDVEALGALASPAGLVPHLRRFHRAPKDLTFDEIQRFADVTADEFADLQARAGKDPRPGSERWLYLSKAYAHDHFSASAAHDLLPRVKPDLFMLHFQCIDWASHEFLQFHGNSSRPVGAQNPAGWRRYDGTVAAFYEYADEWLGRLLALRDADTAVAVVSDHGFEAKLDEEGRGHHNDAAAGILVIEGPGIRKGGRVLDASIYDIFPTVAASYGLPLSHELRGRVLREAFSPSALEATPPTVASYESSQHFVPDVALSDALGGELETELRALGYIN
jgi:hypothetical protein